METCQLLLIVAVTDLPRCTLFIDFVADLEVDIPVLGREVLVRRLGWV